MVDFQRKRDTTVKVRCHLCGTVFTLMVYREDFEKYIAKYGHVQNIFPYLTPGERELLISRTCDECYNKLFAEE